MMSPHSAGATKYRAGKVHTEWARPDTAPARWVYHQFGLNSNEPIMRPALQHEITRLEKIFASHGKPLQRRPGIDEDRLASLEKDLGYEFDQDLRDFYRYSEGAEPGNSWLVVGQQWPNPLDFQSIDESLMYWFSVPFNKAHDEAHYAQLEINFRDYQDERDKRIQPRRWMHRRWWPFGGGGTSFSLMFDADPALGGRHGQIIVFFHDPDEIGYVAESFVDFLRISNDWQESRWNDIHCVE
jgi:cell wall assembly regulator SMI1